MAHGRFITSHEQSGVQRDPRGGFRGDAAHGHTGPVVQASVELRPPVVFAASLGLLPSFLPHLRVDLMLTVRRPRVRFGLGQLCDVKDEADAQVELS